MIPRDQRVDDIVASAIIAFCFFCLGVVIESALAVWIGLVGIVHQWISIGRIVRELD